MQDSKTPHKAWRIIAVVACIVVFFILGIRLARSFYLYKTTELAAECDNGLTIWRRNPGIFSASSYIYEIHDGASMIKSGLRYKELKEYYDETRCVFLGGG